MSQRTFQRGQTLALFALTLLLLTVMVTMTLSFGTKAKEKMELQQVADQAAFSTAVAVARGMNVLAMTNRVAIAHYVAMLGLHSTSSFATLALPVLWGQLIYYAIDLAQQLSYCSSFWMSWCGCPGAAGLTIRSIRTIAELVRVRNVLRSLDPLVGDAARGAGNANIYLYVGQLDTMFNQMWLQALENQRMADRVMNASRPSSAGEWTTPNGASGIAEREVGKVPYVDGALNFTNIIASDRHAVWAAMASRGHPWTAGRFGPLGFSGAGGVLQTYFRVTLWNDPILVINDGSGYFGAYFHTNVLWSSSSKAAVADDHVAWVARYSGFQCSVAPLPLIGVSYTYSQIGLSEHAAGLGFFIPAPAPPTGGPFVVVVVPVHFEPPATHTQVGICALNCPSSWTNFVDYNLFKVAFKDDNFAQPKLPVTVQRNMRNRSGGPDPWNLLFNFRFKDGQQLDLRDQNGIVLPGGVDISLQTALSTGIAYYHRQGHWKEPPNLLNPFWRAGLTRADVDQQARGPGGDIPQMLRDSNAGWAADTYTDLYNAGWRGMQ
jgi:hypothetical protein